MVNKPIDEKAVFNGARQIAAQEERAAYLEQECRHDPAALHRVLDLLRLHEQDNSFLESPALALGMTMDAPAVTEAPGTLIGPYKLREQIGEGGMGLVFVAEQNQPIRR